MPAVYAPGRQKSLSQSGGHGSRTQGRRRHCMTRPQWLVTRDAQSEKSFSEN